MNFSTSEDLTFQQYYTDKYGSIENLIGKAKDGEIVAQADLGMAYSEGFGDVLLKDDDKAIGWLNTAVENGNEFPTVLAKLGELLDRKGMHYISERRTRCTSGQRNWASQILSLI